MPWIEFETSRGLRPFTWNRDVSSKDKHLPNTHHTRYSIHAWKHGRFEYMEWGSEAGITKDASEIWQLLYMKRPVSTHIRERGNYTTHTETNSEKAYKRTQHQRAGQLQDTYQNLFRNRVHYLNCSQMSRRQSLAEGRSTGNFQHLFQVIRLNWDLPPVLPNYPNKPKWIALNKFMYRIFLKRRTLTLNKSNCAV